jgi:maleylacetate reductase
MKDFTYIGRPARVVFGAGKLRELPAEVERLGARKALVLSTPERRAAAEQVAALLGPRAAGVFDKATMHVPIATAREACEYAARIGADCAVAVGGGSTIGLGRRSPASPPCQSSPCLRPMPAPR